MLYRDPTISRIFYSAANTYSTAIIFTTSNSTATIFTTSNSTATTYFTISYSINSSTTTGYSTEYIKSPWP
jgi:hypothetical protein